MALEEAVAELQRCAGTQFDPDVVAMLVSILKDERVTRVDTAAPTNQLAAAVTA
jgi:HD-GYP domain-containing protein (c-di-GMP phosphodiesterase class II)